MDELITEDQAVNGEAGNIVISEDEPIPVLVGQVDPNNDINMDLHEDQLPTPLPPAPAFSMLPGEYSSDDEAFNMKTKGSLSAGSPSDVALLSDAELGEKLRSFGIEVGPVVSSTRRLYERKLESLMAASRQDGPPSPLPVLVDLPPPLPASPPPPLPETSQLPAVPLGVPATGPQVPYLPDGGLPPVPAPQSVPLLADAAPAAGGSVLPPLPAESLPSAAVTMATPGSLDDFSDGEEESAPPPPPLPPFEENGLRRRAGADAPADGCGSQADLSGLDPSSPALRPVFLRDETDHPSPRRAVRDALAAPQPVCKSDHHPWWARHVLGVAVFLLVLATSVFFYCSCEDNVLVKTVREAIGSITGGPAKAPVVEDMLEPAGPLGDQTEPVLPPVMAAEN